MLSKSPVSATFPYQGVKSAGTFYAEKLGLERTGGSADEGWLEFACGDGTSLMLFESDSRKSDDTGATFEVNDLEAEMKGLRAKGIRFEEYDLPGVKTVEGVAQMGGHRMAWIKDPGGNVIALHESK